LTWNSHRLLGLQRNWRLVAERYFIATNKLQRHLSEPNDRIPPFAALHHWALYSITILRRDNLGGVVDEPNLTLELQTGVMIFSLGATLPIRR
jgi:hypothetical protein